MKRLKVSLLILPLVFASLYSNGQLARDVYKLFHPAYFSQQVADTSEFQPWLLQKSKPVYSVEMGSSYSTFGGGLSSSYISPMVSFMATDKLQIIAGGKFSYTNTNSRPILNSETNGLASNGNPTEAFAYGKYQINERFSVYGLGAFGKNQLYFSPFQSGLSTTDYQHLSFGMDYKISDKVRIGASFGYSNSPVWGTSPFGGFGSHQMNPLFP